MKLNTFVLALAPALWVGLAHAEVRFTITNLGTLGGNSSTAYAINASGQVAGSASLADGTVRATRWTNGLALNLGVPFGNNSAAYGINDAGQVAGDSYLGALNRAVLWNATGTPAVLPSAGQVGSLARAINTNGSVVGAISRAGSLSPTLWRDGLVAGLYQPTSSASGFATAINATGQAVGVYNNVAALWQSESSEVRLLPGLGGGTFSLATSINSAGVIVGSSTDIVAGSRAVMWQSGAVTDLGSLGGTSSIAYGVNSRGEAVGTATTTTGADQGFLHTAGGMVNLNTLLAPGSGATITVAYAANVHGQIAGSALIAGQTRAVLLTPSGSVAWQAAGNGSFADATRWEQGYLPSKFVDASIGGIGTQTITVGADAAAKNLSLGSSAGSAGRPTLALQNGAVLSVAGLFTVQGTGTLAGDGTVAGSVVNLGTVLPTNLTVAGSFSNQGLVAGSGTLNAAVANASTGQLRSGAGDLLRINGASHSNAGVIDIRAGGEQQYSGTLANAASGRILLNDAVLRLNSGATNAGQVQVSFGGATVYGSVATTAGGKVILSGNSQTTFFDAHTVESGGELRVSAGSTGVFFGAVTQRTGALFTGTGTKFFEGGLSIGASPGLGLDAGSVNFGVGNLYTAEIGGTNACTAACETNAALRDSSFDKYIVAGHLAFGGTLKLVSWAGFTGQIGQSFDLFDWGSSSGSFSSIDATGLSLASGAVLDTSHLYTAGVLRVTAVPEPGTWALLLCGIGVLLLRLRARRLAP